MKMKAKKNILLLLFLCIWSAMLLWLKPATTLGSFTIERQVSSDAAKLQPVKIYGNRVFKQTFYVEDGWNAIEVMVRNANENADGYFYVKLYNQEGECIKTWKRNKHSLQGDWTLLKTGQLYNAKNYEYTIEVLAPGLKTWNAVCVYSNLDNPYEEGKASLGKKTMGTLQFSVVKAYRNYFAIAALVFSFITIVIVFFIPWRNETIKAACLVFGMGMCWLFIMAPFSQPDSQYHYESTLTLSNALLGRKDLGKVEKEYVDYDGLVLHQNADTAFVRALQDVIPNHPVDKEETYLSTENNTLTTPLLYLPQAVGVTIGRRLGLNFTYTYYLGGLFSLLGYVVMSVVAFRLMPVRKNLILLIEVMPICLHQAVSYSYDTVINGISYILVAYILKMIYDKKKEVTITDMVTVGILSGIAASGKIIYGIAILLLFAVPHERFGGWRKWFKKNCIAFITLLVLLVANNFLTVFGLFQGTYFQASQKRYTLSFIYKEPQYFCGFPDN